MTQQCDDEVFLDGERFGLAEVDGDWPEFDPKHHDLPLEFVGTHCWHGYLCGYRVDERLLLDTVSVGWSEVYAAEHAPQLFGRRARRVNDRSTAWARFEDLGQPVQFTGSLLVGRDRRIHSGLTPAGYSYASVLELRFEAGRLLKKGDVTPEMQRYRADHEAWWPGPGGRDPQPARDSPEDRERALAEFSALRLLFRSYSNFFGSRRRVQGG